MSDTATETDSAHGRQARRAPAVDLDWMTVPELKALIVAAEAKIKDKTAAAQAAMLAKWKAEAKAAGLLLEAVMSAGSRPAKGRKDTGNTLPVKYKSPEGEEWSGRGRLPKWLETAEAEGRSRDEFLVSK